jgi:hypothetical protein
LFSITIAPDAEGGVGASKNGKNGAKTCQAFMRGVAIFAKACFGHPSPSKRFSEVKIFSPR